MKLTVIVDHMSAKSGMLAESGFSAMLEHSGKRVLFDTGASDVVVRNLHALSIDVTSIDMLVLSHGHYDHTWGGASLVVQGLNCPVYASVHIEAPHIIKHGDTIMQGGLFMPLIKNSFVAIEEVTELCKGLWALPTELREKEYIPATPHLLGECGCADEFPDDLSMVLEGENGLSVLTGCAHGGIFNVLKNAAEHFKTDKFYAVIGGFHMAGQGDAYVEKVLDGLKDNFNVKHWRPCHCTGFKAAAKMFRISDSVDWPGAGYSIEL